MEEIHYQALNVTAVVILIGHDHHTAIAELADGLIRLAVLQAENALNGGQLLVRVELLDGDVLDVEQLTTQGEDAPALAADDVEARNRGRGC